MAKINARGARQIGPTLYTERVIPANRSVEGTDRIYEEAWRLRSDGAILTRIIRTRPAEGAEGHVTEHSSGFRLYNVRANVEIIARSTPNEAITILRKHLVRRGVKIVRER